VRRTSRNREGVIICVGNRWLEQDSAGPLVHDRIAAALDLYPCDLLFIHRDAEGESLEARVAEVESGAAGFSDSMVPVVPVRMQEAWLLIDEPALRRATGNPKGSVRLTMPALDRIEQIPNPKQLLHTLLIDASELTGRRRKKLDPRRQAMQLGDLIADYSPLRRLPAFRATEFYWPPKLTRNRPTFLTHPEVALWPTTSDPPRLCRRERRVEGVGSDPQDQRHVRRWARQRDPRDCPRLEEFTQQGAQVSGAGRMASCTSTRCLAASPSPATR